MFFLVGAILGLALGIMIVGLCNVAKTPPCSPETRRSEMFESSEVN